MIVTFKGSKTANTLGTFVFRSSLIQNSNCDTSTVEFAFAIPQASQVD